MKECLAVDFNRCSRFDRVLLKFANARHNILKTVFTDIKEAPLVLLIHFVVPPPFGTLAISPFLAWYAFSPTKRMRGMRSKIKEHFNAKVCSKRFGHLIEKQGEILKVKKRELLSHIKKEEVKTAKELWQKGKAFIKRKLSYTI